MKHYPLLYPGTEVLLPPQLFGSVAYYRLMSRYERARVDTELRFDKRFKSVHRFAIVDAPGVQLLTVPVAKPAGECVWNDVTVSDHGKWWLPMPNALATAYSRTPFFEFYIDRLLPLFSEDIVGLPVTELCARADAIVRGVLCMEDSDGIVTDTDDYRRRPFDEVLGEPAPYSQLRSGTIGFTGGLSVLDLIFNMGPESCLYLTE